MIDTRVVSQELQDKIFEQVRRGQEQVRKGQETVAEAIKSWTATAQAIAPQMPDLPSWTARLPKPEELVANAHDFAGQLLAAQKKSSGQLIAAQKRFAEQARDAVAPLLALAGVASARPVSKPASVSTTGTSTAKASTAKASTAKASTAKASTAKKAGAPRTASATRKASTPRKSAAAKQAAADDK